jgi:hypothetical protein
LLVLLFRIPSTSKHPENSPFLVTSFDLGCEYIYSGSVRIHQEWMFLKTTKTVFDLTNKFDKARVGDDFGVPTEIAL